MYAVRNELRQKARDLEGWLGWQVTDSSKDSEVCLKEAED